MIIDDSTLSEILYDISTGIAVHHACESRGINRRFFYARLNTDPEACNRYGRAKSDGLEAMSNDALHLADSIAGDRDASNAQVQAVRLAVDTRKWLLSKLAPKKYGDRLEVSGSDDSPLRIIVETFADRPKELEDGGGEGGTA